MFGVDNPTRNHKENKRNSFVVSIKRTLGEDIEDVEYGFNVNFT